MRAWDITCFVVAISIAIGAVNGLTACGVVGGGVGDYVTAPQSDYTTYEVEDVEGLSSSSISDTTTADYFTTITSMAFSGIILIINILSAIVCLIPYLVIVFGLDINPLIPVTIQGLLYYQYYVGIAQWRARTSIAVMQ